MNKTQKRIIWESIKLGGTKKYWFIFPCTFLLGFSAPSLFTDNYWIWLLFGVLSLPVAVLALAGDILIGD